MTVTIGAVNDVPVAVDDAAATTEDAAVTIDVLGNDSDADGDPLSVSSVSDPANGSVANNGVDVTYTPDTDFFGVDSFTYVVNDGTVDGNTATVTVTVTAVNDAPVAVDDSASTTEDVAVDIDVLANDSDADGDGLSVSSTSDPANGSVVNNGTDVSYTPDPGFTGDDTFTYIISDGVETASASVTVTVSLDAGVVQVASSESSIDGNISSGNYTDTAVEDGTVEALSEQETGGRRNRRVSELDHRWSIDVLPGSQIVLSVVGQVTTGTEQFELSYSTNGGSSFVAFDPAIVIDNSAPSLITRDLPSNISGEVVVRLLDLDRTQGADPEDTVEIDYLAITTFGATEPLPAVSVTASSSTAVESDPSVSFTFSRTGDLTDGLTASISTSGDATAGADYTAPPSTVTFNPGSATANLVVSLLDDADVESSESLTITVDPSADYDVGSPASATVTLLDDDGSGQTVTASGESTSSGSVSGTYVATQVSDNGYQTITEEGYGGSRSRLQHSWTFAVGSCLDPSIRVEASHNSTAETFVFSYSDDVTSLINFYSMSAGGVETSVDTPVPTLTGTVTIQVIDSDRSRNERTLDTVSIDHLSITCN